MRQCLKTNVCKVGSEASSDLSKRRSYIILRFKAHILKNCGVSKLALFCRIFIYSLFEFQR